ncbi:MAG TPA: tripartite tricarboxylate transporter substrate binding protein [Xanthobacteraceae bacterium]|nr:tripartite tricarboxylate transporter substrate binding protein [Xanthobacteraceae bacterium]
MIERAALFLVLALLAAAPVAAQDYPVRPIHLIVPAAPGGPTDLPARLVAQILPDLGQAAVVENRPGGGGVIGARSVAAATPDGYTLLVGNTSVLAVIPAVSASAGYDPAKNFAPVAKLSESYQILVVPAASPFRSLHDLVAFAKLHPGKLNVAHTGEGGLPHLTVKLLEARAGIDLVGVPYKSGGESVTAVLGGQVDMTIEGITILLPLIRDGKLRALAVTSAERTPLAPDLPTMIEAGVPDYEVTTFNGVVAPAGTPAAIVAKLNAAITAGLQTPDMQARLQKLGAISRPSSPAAFGAFIAAEHAKWSALGIRVN